MTNKGAGRPYYILSILLGAGVVAGAVLMPSSQDFAVFRVLLASLGVFIVFFGRGARIPAVLLAIYGFAVAFPLALAVHGGEAYTSGITSPLLFLLNALGYPIQNEGQLIYFSSSGGEPISVVLGLGCAGPVTMGVFIALFVLMMLDRPLPPGRAGGVFLLGVAGTWLQSFLRLVILLLSGYHLGSSALWTAHYWTIYILFPLWYLAFALFYFHQLKRPAKAGGESGLKYKLAVGR